MPKRFSKNEWGFAGVMGIQATAILALQIYILTQWQIWVKSTVTQVTISFTVPIDIAILIFACFYAGILALDAIYSRNNILLLAICVSNCLILAFAAMQYRELLQTSITLPQARDMYDESLVHLDRDWWAYVQPAELATNLILGVCILPTWYFAYKVHSEYKWVIYRRIHGDSTIKIKYLAYEIYLVLTKFNFFFSIGFIIQYNLIDVHFEEPEYSLTMALIPVVFFAMVLGIWFVRKEWKWAMIGIIICYLALIAYFLSRIITLYGDGWRALTAGKDKMLLFSITAVCLTTLSLAFAIQCIVNFDQGLRSVISEAGGHKLAPYDFRSISSPSPRTSHSSRFGVD
ncbi:hypothetical protein PENSTE_c019G00708 [Penicillium steckii]|uniref:Uncharacterized protein n=1 Tax=Penicillium steckii TaxID=303698 RepID=A0A1V6SVC0_9EURO|nr:hypothetical protein PENSTE_c019G00708 [Penicillium steckii]